MQVKQYLILLKYNLNATGVSLINCNSTGPKWILGAGDRYDDVKITCTNGKVTNLKMN